MIKSIKDIIKKHIPEKNWLFLIKLKQQYKNYIQKQSDKKLIKQTYLHYNIIENTLKKNPDKIIRFASYVVYDSSFSAYGIMDLMLADKSKFSARIVVVPDVSRGNNNLIEQYKKTKDFFVNLYGAENVIDGYNIDTNEFIDVSEQFDIINLACPYDYMVNKVHGIKYLSTKNILPIYISYGCMPDKYGCKEIMPMIEISLFWKVFADNKISFNDYKKYELSKGKNVVCTGYAKMDSLSKSIRNQKDKKTIILAPHHTVNTPSFPLSNFLQYSDFILNLPKKYPDIEFIFRPHPLLFINLINKNIWTKEQVNNYIQKIEQLGIKYSFGGNYFDVFLNSDAIIHDCSSFVVEYLYTNNPCCFVANENTKKIFSKLGKACLKNYYIAFNEEQILKFIDDVVIKDNDILRQKRIAFSNKYIKLNYPNVSKEILNYITL